MSRGRNVHVVPRGGNWGVRIEGNERLTRVTRTQREAIDIGREIARQEESEFFMHRANGTIRERDSYGRDPCPPRG